MTTKVIAIDQSTQSTKAFLFSEDGMLLGSASLAHRQLYPQAGYVEHDAEEIYRNTVAVISELVSQDPDKKVRYSLAITNQRETVVVWNRLTGRPVCNAIVWQDMRGRDICGKLETDGFSELIRSRTGLLIDPYFSASGIKWILDNIDGVREEALKGNILAGNIDSWLIWKLTGGKSHVTDYTNASRTMLFNVHSLSWDEDILRIMDIPQSMLPQALPCDSVFGETTVEGLFGEPVEIAGAIGDSHGALTGQMCFSEGLGKATYGTGSSVMVNIGENFADAPSGLVTSVGFAALGKVFYAFEGNIHCTGMTITWLEKELGIIGGAAETEALATSVQDNGGVYFVPAFAGLGAPWWKPDVRAAISGLTLGTGRAHICRAALESIAYQVEDLTGAMTDSAGIRLRELRVDGGPTRNAFLMQFQADLLRVPVVRSEKEDASAFGAFIMNGFARGKWHSFEEASCLADFSGAVTPDPCDNTAATGHEGWVKAVKQLINNQ